MKKKAKDEMILTFLMSQAQAESESMSSNMQMMMTIPRD